MEQTNTQNANVNPMEANPSIKKPSKQSDSKSAKAAQPAKTSKTSAKKSSTAKSKAKTETPAKSSPKTTAKAETPAKGKAKLSESSHTLISEICKASQMGINALDVLVDKVTQQDVLEELIIERGAYKTLCDNAAKLLPTGKAQIDIIGQVTSWISIQTNTFLDKSPARVAELLMQGNLMGVISITKALNANAKAEPNVKDLAIKFVGLCEKHIQKLKGFLN